jgi:hypothetical protein
MEKVLSLKMTEHKLNEIKNSVDNYTLNKLDPEVKR